MLVSDVHRARLLGLIRQWPANRRLTWTNIVEWGVEHCNHRWTRQTLCGQPALRDAYEAHAELRKKRKEGKRGMSVVNPENQVIADRIERLEIEKAEFLKALAQYDEKFVRYIGNAIRYGISQEKLEAPLVEVNKRLG